MADDFRQNPGRERAVTDSILRPPVQAPFDLLDEGIRAIPELIEQRRQEGVEEELQYNLLGARLTAEQAADARAYHSERLNNMLAQYAAIDWSIPENAAFKPQMEAAIAAAEDALLQLSQPFTAEAMRSGETARRVADAGASELGIAQAQAFAGPAVTASERAEADRVAQRDAAIQADLLNLSADRQLELQQIILGNQNDQAALDRELSVWLQENAQQWQGSEAELARVFTQLMTREGFAHELDVLGRQQAFQAGEAALSREQERELVELSQEWQSIENQYGRDFEGAERAKDRALQTWLAEQDIEFRTWATEYEGELEERLQSNEFRQQHDILDKQQAFNRELTELAQQHDLLVQENQLNHAAAESELDRSLSERINSANITSQEGIEAARLQLAQLESDRGYELNSARTRLLQLEQDLKIRIHDDDQARMIYEEQRDDLDQYAGDPQNPEIQEILTLARGYYGENNAYYLQLERQAIALGSPAARDMQAQRTANISLVEAQVDLTRTQAALGEEQITEMQFKNTRDIQLAALADMETTRAALADVMKTGNVPAAEHYKRLQDNPDLMARLPPEVQDFILNADMDIVLEEAQATLDAIGGERAWAETQREITTERHEADMARAEQEYLQGQITTVDMQRAQSLAIIDNAMSYAATFPDRDSLDETLDRLRSPSHEAQLAKLGGETFLAEVEAAFSAQQLTDHLDDRQQVARLFLETPLVDGTPEQVEAWKQDAQQALMEVYPSMAPDEALVIAERLVSEEFDRRLFREFDIESRLIDLSASPEGVSGADFNEIRMALSDYRAGEDRWIRTRYSQCFSQPEDPVGRTGMGENAECSEQDQREITEYMDRVRANSDQWTYELLGLLPAAAGTTSGGVEYDFRNLPPAAQDALDAAFAQQVPYSPPADATEQDEIAYADWYVNEQRRWLGAMLGGDGFVPVDYQTGEERRIYGENDVSSAERMNRQLGGGLLRAFGAEPLWEMITAIRSGEPWYSPSGLGGDTSPAEAPSEPPGGAEAPLPADTAVPDAAPVPPAQGGQVRGSAPPPTAFVGSVMQHFRESGFGFRDAREALGDDYEELAAKRATIRHNNPGALEFHSQSGATSVRAMTGDDSVRDWAHFETMEDGFQALLNQQVLYANNDSSSTRNLGRSPTISEMVNIYAPAIENSTDSRAGYVNRIVTRLTEAGFPVTGDTPLKQVTDNPEALVELGLAMASYEMGMDAFSRVFAPAGGATAGAPAASDTMAEAPPRPPTENPALSGMLDQR